jgi:hypothetical protein
VNGNPKKEPTNIEDHFRVISLEKRKYLAEYVVSEWDALECGAETVIDGIHNQQRYRLTAGIWTELDRRIVVKQKPIGLMFPADWSGWFKSRWFPKWLLRWFPITKWERIDVKEIDIDEPVFKACYINLPKHNGSSMCLYEAATPEYARKLSGGLIR